MTLGCGAFVIFQQVLLSFCYDVKSRVQCWDYFW